MICKNCKGEIEKKAVVCVHCGSKIKKPLYRKWWIWVIVAIIAIAVSSGNNNDRSNTKNQTVGSSTDATTLSEDKNAYKSGMYKIGSDMPAGEYVIINESMTYFAITSDSSGKFESIIANDNFKNRSIVTVSEGQYLEFNGGKAYSINEAPSVKIKDGVLEEGMYKVGQDIPAGEYKIEATASSMGYVEVSADSSHGFMSIVSNDNFEGEKYISVSDGQYIKFSRAILRMNN